MVRFDLIWAGVELVYDTGILVYKEEGWQHYYLIREETEKKILDVSMLRRLCTSSTAIKQLQLMHN